jgi:hypothetical protein
MGCAGVHAWNESCACGAVVYRWDERKVAGGRLPWRKEGVFHCRGSIELLEQEPSPRIAGSQAEFLEVLLLRGYFVAEGG